MSSFVCLSPGHIPISGTLKFLSPEREHFAGLVDCGWKMNCAAGVCLTDLASPIWTRVKEAVEKYHFVICFNYLV